MIRTWIPKKSCFILMLLLTWAQMGLSEQSIQSEWTYYGPIISIFHGGNGNPDVSQWPSFPRTLNDLETVGFNSIEIRFNISLDQATDKVSRQHEAPYLNATDEGIVAAIQQAKSRGFRVALSVVLHPINPTGAWMGEYKPANPTTFFESFQEVMVDFAELAEANGVDLFFLGAEYVELTKDTYFSHWESMVEQIRGVYSGRLSYGVHNSTPFHWDNEEIYHFSLASLLDVVGLTVYPRLTTTGNVDADDFAAAWYSNSVNKNEFELIKEYQAVWDKPVIFHEIGIGSFDGAGMIPNVFPSSDDDSFTPDEGEQAAYFEGFLRTWLSERPDWLEGFYVWHWRQLDYFRTSDYSIDHDFQDKQAEDVFRSWLSRPFEVEGPDHQLLSGQSKSIQVKRASVLESEYWLDLAADGECNVTPDSLHFDAQDQSHSFEVKANSNPGADRSTCLVRINRRDSQTPSTKLPSLRVFVINSQEAVPGGFDGSFSGSWFNPNRDGEGFVFDIAENSSGPVMVVYWYTYFRKNPYWLIGVAPFEEGQSNITLELLEFSGTEFGDLFNPNELEHRAWGEISIQFSSCDEGRATWSSYVGFDEGQSDLRRITNGILGNPCER